MRVRRERVPTTEARGIVPERIALGADHGGFALKENLKVFLLESGYEIEDVGTSSPAAVDYPPLARAVADRVASGSCGRGIFIDATGLGSCMTANRVRGVRCATCHDERTAISSRSHNDANMLALGASVLHPGYARRIVRLWLATAFEGGRHARRVAQIMAADEERGSSHA
jgi:ribose 5-phosphate isomerase B